MTISNPYRLRTIIRRYVDMGDRLYEIETDTIGALLELAFAANDIAYVFDCRCDKAWTERGLHAPECKREEGTELRDALELFDWRDH